MKGGGKHFHDTSLVMTIKIDDVRYHSPRVTLKVRNPNLKEKDKK